LKLAYGLGEGMLICRRLSNEKKFIENNFYYQFMSVSSLIPMTCRIFEFNESRGIKQTSGLMIPFKT